MRAAMRSMGWSVGLLPVALAVTPLAVGADPASSPDASTMPPPVEMTAQQDHQRLMDLLHITSLRRGADGNNRQAPNAANYDESKANPYPSLPDPLVNSHLLPAGEHLRLVLRQVRLHREGRFRQVDGGFKVHRH